MTFIRSKYVNLIGLLRNERRSLNELIHLQNLALQRLIKHAYNTVPFYKNLFNNINLHYKDIKTTEDITKIPVIDKQIFKQNPLNELLSSEYINRKLIPITTAGSSGTMLKFFIDHSYDQFRKAQALRPYITNGRRPFDRVLIFSPPQRTSKKWFQYLGIMNIHRVYYNTDSFEQIKSIQDYKPKIIQGCASVLNLLSVLILDNKISVPPVPLIFTDSEVLSITMRKNIEEAFSADVIDIYGTYETDNVAYECSAHQGYHIAADSVIMEFISKSKKAEPSEEAEIVMTVLNNYAMPFIRYNLHDLGSYTNRSCSCGRTFPLLTKISGRLNDYMVRRDGRKLSFVNLESYWHSLTKYLHEYQVIQEDIDTFSVFAVPNNSFNDDCKALFFSEINKYFPGARIKINVVQSIKREESGKFMTFKSRVN